MSSRNKVKNVSKKLSSRHMNIQRLNDNDFNLSSDFKDDISTKLIQSNKAALNKASQSSERSESKDCPTCKTSVLMNEYAAHVSSCLRQNFTLHKTRTLAQSEKEGEGGGLMLCQICQSDLSDLPATEATRHVNECLDRTENESNAKAKPNETKNSREKSLECNICGKFLKTLMTKKAHMKRCAKKYEVPASALNQAPGNRTAPIPLHKFEEETQIAMAISTSLNETAGESCCDVDGNLRPTDTSAVPAKDAFAILMSQTFPSNTVPKKGKKQKQKGPSLLLTQSHEECQRKLMDRLSALIVPMSPEKSASTVSSVRQSKLIHCRKRDSLWAEASLHQSDLDLSPSNKLKFYVNELMPTVEPSSRVAGTKFRRMSAIYGWKPVNSGDRDKEKAAGLSGDMLHNTTMFASTQTALCLAEMASDRSLIASQPSAQQTQTPNSKKASQTDTQGGIIIPIEAGDEIDLAACGDVSQREWVNYDPEKCTKEQVAVDREPVDTLIQSLSSMVNNPVLSDITLRSKDSDIHCHKFILRARCGHSTWQWLEGCSSVDVSEFDEDSVLLMLQYLYTGKAGIPEDKSAQVSLLSEKFDLPFLESICKTTMKTSEHSSYLDACDQSILSTTNDLDPPVSDLDPLKVTHLSRGQLDKTLQHILADAWGVDTDSDSDTSSTESDENCAKSDSEEHETELPCEQYDSDDSTKRKIDKDDKKKVTWNCDMSDSLLDKLSESFGSSHHIHYSDNDNDDDKRLDSGDNTECESSCDEGHSSVGNDNSDGFSSDNGDDNCDNDGNSDNGHENSDNGDGSIDNGDDSIDNGDDSIKNGDGSINNSDTIEDLLLSTQQCVDLLSSPSLPLKLTPDNSPVNSPCSPELYESEEDVSLFDEKTSESNRISNSADLLLSSSNAENVRLTSEDICTPSLPSLDPPASSSCISSLDVSQSKAAAEAVTPDMFASIAAKAIAEQVVKEHNNNMMKTPTGDSANLDVAATDNLLEASGSSENADPVFIESDISVLSGRTPGKDGITPVPCDCRHSSCDTVSSHETSASPVFPSSLNNTFTMSAKSQEGGTPADCNKRAPLPCKRKLVSTEDTVSDSYPKRSRRISRTSLNKTSVSNGEDLIDLTGDDDDQLHLVNSDAENHFRSDVDETQSAHGKNADLAKDSDSSFCSDQSFASAGCVINQELNGRHDKKVTVDSRSPSAYESPLCSDEWDNYDDVGITTPEKDTNFDRRRHTNESDDDGFNDCVHDNHDNNADNSDNDDSADINDDNDGADNGDDDDIPLKELTSNEDVTSKHQSVLSDTGTGCSSQSASSSPDHHPDNDVWQDFDDDGVHVIDISPFSSQALSSHTESAKDKGGKSECQTSMKRASLDLSYDPPTDIETDVSLVQQNNPTPQAPRNNINKVKKTKAKKKGTKKPSVPSPFTPMPEYKNLQTPHLRNACKKFGLKALPKKKMINVLTNIFQSTHQYETDSEVDESLMPAPVVSLIDTNNQNSNTTHNRPNKNKMKPTKLTATRGKNNTQKRKAPEKPAQSDDTAHGGATDDEDSDSSDSEEKSDLLEESMLVMGKKSGVSMRDVGAKKKVVWDYIKAHDDICTKALMYQPLEFEEFHEEIKNTGHNIGVGIVMDALDDLCIQFTMRGKEKGSRQKKRKVKSANKSPKSSQRNQKH